MNTDAVIVWQGFSIDISVHSLLLAAAGCVVTLLLLYLILRKRKPN